MARILNVRASDKSTGKSNQITITNETWMRKRDRKRPATFRFENVPGEGSFVAERDWSHGSGSWEVTWAQNWWIEDASSSLGQDTSSHCGNYPNSTGEPTGAKKISWYIFFRAKPRLEQKYYWPAAGFVFEPTAWQLVTWPTVRPRFRAEDEANKHKIEAKNGLEMPGTAIFAGA